MGSDVKQSLAAAEKLLKAGKVAEAIASFDRVVDESNGDLLTVNRVGDAIVAAGKPDKAVPYYARIADQFSRQGFYPKAIAIRKKILRLTPESSEALVGLADLYVRQEHPAEARTYYLRAADQLLQGKDFGGAQTVYERLVEAEPDDPRHRVRLAETRAAAGDEAEAAEDLVGLGQRLLESGKPEDAEKAFRRAGELAPDRSDVVTGLIACLTETGRDDEALKLLEEEVAKPDATIELVAELLVLYEVNGRVDEATAVLEGPRAHELPQDTFRTLVRLHERKDDLGDLWSRLDPVLRGWVEGDLRVRLLALLDALPTWTEKPVLPALEWHLELVDEDSDESAQVRSLERLIEAYPSDRQDDADRARERLEQLRPAEPEEVLPEEPPRQSEAAEPHASVAEPAEREEVSVNRDVPVEYEAPAVPLSRADEEFVSGRMTQAEILEKYGLLTQAMDQVYEVIERFPGHLEANQHLVTLLRGTSQSSALAQALVKLALARRAAGRLEIAQQSAAEADRLGGLDPHMREILVALDLFPTEGPASDVTESAPAPAADVPASQPAEPKKVAPEKEPTPTVAKPEAPVALRADAVIDFDSFDEDDDEDDAEAAPLVERPPAEPVAEQPSEVPAEPIAAAGTEAAMRFEPLPAVGDQDDDDLSAIAAALDDELFDEDPLGDAPASESEESLDEVFAAFRERVEEEVGADDFRTHYDLGIGYKEMGLLDAAIAEFEISVK
ncbi:MAG: tetratricopeptide repeat protein, partial [Planctomycetota bacterium]|nr:tetratricopeptide repeat protein [Planctomycetota bacterium]